MCSKCEKNNEVRPHYSGALGFIKDENYMRSWKEKEDIYNKNGFSVEKGNLIISKDINMAINSEVINKNVKFILENIDKI